jgi:hypothetical protein
MQADLDLGNYERFLDVTLSKDHNITTGKVYSKVLAAERRGDYLGKTVQVIPHVTDEIQDWIERVSVRDVDGATCMYPASFIHSYMPHDIPCLLHIIYMQVSAVVAVLSLVRLRVVLQMCV